MTNITNQVRRAIEARLDEMQPPQIRTNESPVSPNNVIIEDRKRLLSASIIITTNFDVVEEVDAPVRDAYLSQVESVVRSGLITLGSYADSSDNADLMALCLELMDEYERTDLTSDKILPEVRADEDERMEKALYDERVERKAQLEVYLLQKEAKAGC